METMRDRWTDERMDDLREDMNRGFARSDLDLRELRADMGSLRAEVNQLRSETNSRFDSMQRTMIIGFATLGGGLLASVAATILAAVFS